MLSFFLLFSASVVSTDMEAELMKIIPQAKKAVVFIGGGSGVVISPDGLVLTCSHVVGNLKRWEVYLAGGKTFQGKVLGRHLEADLAVIRLDNAGSLPFLPIAVPGNVRVGETVLALGNPFLIGSQNPYFLPLPPEFNPSVSCGIISMVHRFNRLFSDFIECDVPINPGNSGGPIINTRGEIVGIASRIASRFGIRTSTGVGYAPACGLIRKVLPALIKAEGRTVVPGTVHGLKLEKREGNVVVSGIEKDASQQAKLFRGGDVVVSVGSLRIRSVEHFFSALATYVVGQEAVCWVKRGSGSVLLKFKVESRSRTVALIGIKGEDNSKGIMIQEVNKDAKKAGLAVGDLLVAVEGVPLSSTQELAMMMLAMKPGRKVQVTVKRGGEEKKFTIELGKCDRDKQGRPYL